MAEEIVPYDGPVVTRQAARNAAAKYYFTGKRCKHGHLSKRWTNDAICCACRAVTRRLRRKRPEPVLDVSVPLYKGPIITKEEARLLGKKRFFTGVLCRKGHMVERSVCSNGCLECQSINKKNNYYNNREQHLLYSKEYRDKYKDLLNRKNLAHYYANRDAYMKKNREWWDRHPGQALANSRNRKAKLKASAGKHTLADIREILTQQRWKCAYCKACLKKNPRHVDHIKPVSKGGDNGRRNLQMLCKPCNHAKYAHDPLDYARKIGMLL